MIDPKNIKIGAKVVSIRNNKVRTIVKNPSFPLAAFPDQRLPGPDEVMLTTVQLNPHMFALYEEPKESAAEKNWTNEEVTEFAQHIYNLLKAGTPPQGILTYFKGHNLEIKTS